MEPEMMERFFNTAGPVAAAKHYCLDPLGRVDLEEIRRLIAQEKYFVLHAPRQTGKTSVLLALAEKLNHEGRYRALYANIEAAQAYREDVKSGLAAVVQSLAGAARDQFEDMTALPLAEATLKSFPETALERYLGPWCRQSAQPVVLLLDEVDALIGDTLIALLRQIRSGYTQRPGAFPQSIVLCGVRDVRDYRIHSAAEKAVITGGSAFNVKARSLRLGDLDRLEMEALYAQHTAATGQAFTPEALELAWELTRGQPWLVNALAYETCFEMREGRDRSRPVSVAMVETAKENLILRRETHLDQLADKLQEARVRRVVAPLLTGEMLDPAVSEDDKAYVVDLGLVRRGTEGLQIANPIYQEIIPRQLTATAQDNLEAAIRAEWYVRPDGRLDLPKLLSAFQEFYREHSEHWLDGMPYREAGPQLLLQAILQRVVNGGGRVEREYGLGRGRTDLLVKWPQPDGAWQKAVIELKVLHKTLERTLAEGLVQTRAYLDRCGVAEGHLVIFDRRPERSWEEKVFCREEIADGAPVTVWGM